MFDGVGLGLMCMANSCTASVALTLTLLSRTHTHTHKDLAQTMVGTIRYMSPERLAGAGYGGPADVWSLGVLLLEMSTRKLPFDNTVSQIDLHDRLERLVVDDIIAQCCPGSSREFQEVLRACLERDPELRLRPEELLKLDWFGPFQNENG
ncbi:unnamed protein product, partial [Discosporangium mesarthrocarpum]